MRCLKKAYQFLCLVLLFLNFQANLSSSSSSITQLCSHDEAAALIQFKSSFMVDKFLSISSHCEDAGIESYPKTDSWKEGTDCCSWDGVTCDDINGHVIGLDLTCNRLYGTFPSNSSLFHLPHLQKLYLAFNNFNSSKMSSKFGKFASLMYLNLSETNFAGQVPSQVSHLSKLVSLDLSLNVFQRLDKHTLEGLVHNLTEVKQLFLDGINMSSINPNVLMNLSSSLRSLSLQDCDLRGKFPENIFHLPNLKMLDLEYNENLNLSFPKLNQTSHLKLLYLSYMFFSRELFDSIGNLVSLEQLDAISTIFSGGGLPESFENLISLKHLDLSYSNLSGSIPTSLGKLISLKHLDLSFSNLSGSIPTSLGNLSQISYLDLSSNFLSGQIPSSLTNLKQLEILGFQNNLLEGSIPDEVSAFPSLIHLDLSSNLLKGTLPSWLYTISSLKYVYLYNNQFTGHVKEFQYKSLEEIYLQNNKLQGPIPSSIFQLRNLQHLDLSYNSLLSNSNGTSADLDHYPWKKLQFLNLRSNLLEGPVLVPPPSIQIFLVSENKLTGGIPSLICNLSSLETLDLSDNNLSGTIPHCFGNLSSLGILNLSDNNLSGTIPTCLGFLSNNLYVLDLQKNSFHGTIPDSFAKENALQSLNLNGNDFDGPLPQSLVNCSMWAVLNLGNNRLNDTFPYWLGTLLELQVLVLRSNNFHGPIGKAKTESPFPKLRILDLSHNEFSSVLPTKYFKSFKSMMNLDNVEVRYMGEGIYYQDSMVVSMKGSEFELQRILTIFTTIDFSSNQFKGKIPERVGELTSLKVLNFSHNSLSGSIPSSLGKLTAVESLDLSSNKLVGEIPKQLTNLKFLEVLNLSHNQLSGPIPQGNQFNTFSNDSYSDNLGLCGFPLSKRCSKNEAPALQEEGDGSASAFEWKGVMMGYGCGLVFGLSAGYIIFTIGKPRWLVRIVKRAGNKLKRYHWSTK